jgi:hypothetical protein
MTNKSAFESKSYLAAVIVTFIISSFARAQDTDTSNADTDVPKATRATQPAGSPEATESTNTTVRDGSTRSPAAALWMSVGSTLVPAALGGGLLATHSGDAKIAGWTILGAGLVFGPSVGQFYSGRWGKGLLFALGRGAAAGVMAGGIVMFLEGDHGGSTTGGTVVMILGGIAGTALIVWGIADSYKSAKQYNEEHAKKSITLSPFVMPSSGRDGEKGMAYGLALAGNF